MSLRAVLWYPLSLWHVARKRRFSFFLLLGVIVVYKMLPVDEQSQVYERVKLLMTDQQEMVLRLLVGEQEHIQQSPEPEVYTERLRTIENTCLKLPIKPVHWNKYFTDAWFVESHKLIYCEVPKVGCTFWKRTLEILRRDSPELKSPYRLPYEECVHGRMQFFISAQRQKKESGLTRKEIFAQRYKKIMFVRDPFKRLFSAYIDKFFNPNKDFWKVAASFLKFRYAERVDHGEKPGHDLSFAEFVEMVAAPHSYYHDPHFNPISQMCEICGVKYDIIGKMETFKTDVFHILSLVNASQKVNFANFEMEASVDFITEMIGKVFIYREGLEKFMDFHDILIRVWERLKIANMLDVDDPFPLLRGASDDIDVELFVKVVVQRFISSYDRSRQNKKAAYLQAYRQLSEEQIGWIRQTYKLDFEMFGYDIAGPDLEFENSLADSVKEYDFFNILSK